MRYPDIEPVIKPTAKKNHRGFHAPSAFSGPKCGRCGRYYNPLKGKHIC